MYRVELGHGHASVQSRLRPLPLPTPRRPLWTCAGGRWRLARSRRGSRAGAWTRSCCTAARRRSATRTSRTGRAHACKASQGEGRRSTGPHCTARHLAAGGTEFTYVNPSPNLVIPGPPPSRPFPPPLSSPTLQPPGPFCGPRFAPYPNEFYPDGTPGAFCLQSAPALRMLPYPPLPRGRPVWAHVRPSQTCPERPANEYLRNAAFQ